MRYVAPLSAKKWKKETAKCLPTWLDEEMVIKKRQKWSWFYDCKELKNMHWYIHAGMFHTFKHVYCMTMYLNLYFMPSIATLHKCRSEFQWAHVTSPDHRCTWRKTRNPCWGDANAHLFQLAEIAGQMSNAHRPAHTPGSEQMVRSSLPFLQRFISAICAAFWWRAHNTRMQTQDLDELADSWR